MTKRLVYNLMRRVMVGISAPEYFDKTSSCCSKRRSSPSSVCIRAAWVGPVCGGARAPPDTLTAKIIRLHQPENRGERPPDIIDHLLAVHRSDPSFLPETDLGIVALEPIFAPLDTLAHSLSFMLYELLKRPDLLHRARTEAHTVFEHGGPTAQRLQQLDAIRRTYLETSRLYATVPRTVRTVANSFEFAGCTMPADRQVILDFTLTHHLPEFFPDPERFDIDRFAPPRNEHRQSATYMPYGVGTHRCLEGGPGGIRNPDGHGNPSARRAAGARPARLHADGLEDQGACPRAIRASRSGFAWRASARLPPVRRTTEGPIRKGRFPHYHKEAPMLAVGHVAVQLEALPTVWFDYPLKGRSGGRNREQLRAFLGFRQATVNDTEPTRLWLSQEVVPQNQDLRHLRSAGHDRCLEYQIEPPSSDRIDRVVGATVRSCETALFTAIQGFLAGGGEILP